MQCPECRAQIPEHHLRRLLPGDTVDRMISQGLERAVSSEADLWPCPTPNCRYRVCYEEGDLPRLNCPACKKVSCLLCGAQPYHRGRTCAEHAERLQARGIQREEDSIKRWMKETGSKQCPTCRMVVSKQNIRNQATQYSECHKMLCRNCGSRFCFKCLAVLTDTYTCGCSIDLHGFIDPHTGKRIQHLRRGQGKGARKAKAPAGAKAGGAAGGKHRAKAKAKAGARAEAKPEAKARARAGAAERPPQSQAPRRSRR